MKWPREGWKNTASKAISNITRSSDVAEEPRDATVTQLKLCHDV